MSKSSPAGLKKSRLMLANPLRNIRNNESPKIRAGLSVLMPTFSCDSRSHGIAAIDAKKSTIFFESKSVNVGNCCDGCLFITLFLFVFVCFWNVSSAASRHIAAGRRAGSLLQRANAAVIATFLMKSTVANDFFFASSLFLRPLSMDTFLRLGIFQKNPGKLEFSWNIPTSPAIFTETEWF